MSENAVDVEIAGSEHRGFRKFYLMDQNTQEEGSFEINKSECWFKLPSGSLSKWLPDVIKSVPEIVFNNSPKLKEVEIDLTTNETNLTIFAIQEILKIKKNINGNFDIIISDECINLIKTTPFYTKNKKLLRIKSEADKEKKDFQAKFIFLENLSLTKDLSEIDFKVFMYLHGKALTPVPVGNFTGQVFSYSEIFSVFEKTLSFNDKAIHNAINNLSQRGIITLYHFEDNDDFKLFQFNYQNTE